MRRTLLVSAFFPLLALAHLFAQLPQAFQLSGDYAGTHDPSITREGTAYYVFATTPEPSHGEFPIRCSTDLHVWKLCGHVFDQIPAWILAASPKTAVLWAPDISYVNNRFHLYYAYSTFGGNASGIALATNETLDPTSPHYHWKDEGLVLQSTTSDDFNAIDPNLVFDASGQAWISFGSFWSGIKMRRIDNATGKPFANDSTTYSLASRLAPEHPESARPGLPPNWQAIEAPFIVRHGGYYYLFVSFDLCCRGTHSTYRTMVGRSHRVTGPYVDAKGKPMLKGGGTQLLYSNNKWLGPGGASILSRPEGDLLVFHAYDAMTGMPALQISTVTWEHGWPHAELGTAAEVK